MTGVQYIPLRSDAKERTGTFLLKMAPGSTYPPHRHPGGEELMVLKGEMSVSGQGMKVGDFLFAPPGSIHEVTSETGCMFLSILPEPLEIIGSKTPREFDEIPS